MTYLTLKEAAETTGLSEMTIRRLCKKKESKPFIHFEKGKNGIKYTVQSNYLFNIYPPLKLSESTAYTKVNTDYTGIPLQPIHDNVALLAAKDEIIELLKSETIYLRSENTSLREENKVLKLLSAPNQSSELSAVDSVNDQKPAQTKKSFWQRLFG